MLRFVIFTGFLILSGCVTESVKLKQNPGLSWYKVEYVIDGELILVNGIGRVQYIGVEAPDKSLTGRRKEPFFDEALEKNRELVEGKFVRFEFDKKRENEKGWLLAYVFVREDYNTEIFVNAEMLRLGLARYKSSTVNTKHLELLQNIQNRARAQRAGIWALEKFK